jgi:hypothetical protein
MRCYAIRDSKESAPGGVQVTIRGVSSTWLPVRRPGLVGIRRRAAALRGGPRHQGLAFALLQKEHRCG